MHCFLPSHKKKNNFSLQHCLSKHISKIPKKMKSSTLSKKSLGSQKKKEQEEICGDSKREHVHGVVGGRGGSTTMSLLETRVRERPPVSHPTLQGGQQEVVTSCASPATSGESISDANTDSPLLNFSNQEIEALLRQKIKGKFKFDHKGKCEQMMGYIKKLRDCIRSFKKMETTYILEKENLQNELLKEKTERSHSGLTAGWFESEKSLNGRD